MHYFPSAYLPSVRKWSYRTVISAKHRYLINHYRIEEAVGNNRIKLVKILIALGDLEEFPNWDETLLPAAVRNGHTELIKLLIFHGARPKVLIKAIRGFFSVIAKKNVIKNNELETLSLLSSQSPELGTKLLEVAILQGNSEVAQMLLDRQVPINYEMLELAAKKSDRYLIEKLLELGVQLSIHTKAFWGDLAAVIDYVEAGGEVNIVNKYSRRTLLHEAVAGGNKEMVEFLLAHGANVNASSRDGAALHQAATCCNLEIAKILIAGGADVNNCYRYGTPLHKAAASGSREIAALLIANGAEVNHGNGDNDFFPLHKAAAAGQSQMIDFLIAEGAEVNIKTGRGETPLHVAANRDTAERLIARGADINAYSESYGTPIKTATSKKRFDVVELLLELGADVKSKNALWSALDSPKIAKLLILNGANVNDYWEYQPYLVARGKITLLHSAVRGGILAGRGGCLPVVELLVTNGAEVDPRDCYSCTPLYLAVLQENYLIVEYLITKGANINTCDEEYGITPLHQAVRFGNYHLVELLLGNGADVNANRAECPKIYETAGDRSPRDLPSLRSDSLLSNAYAKTPLHLVWDLDVATLLIAYGADVNAQDLKDGNTPLHSLVWLGEGGKEIVELLIDRGADITATNNYGQTILHQAAKFGCPYWLEYFIALGADVNATDCYGATPLHLAIERFNSNDKFEIAKLLISWHEDYDEYIVSYPTLYYSLCQRFQALVEVLIFNGADVNLANNNGETILHLAVKAVKNGLPNIVELVLAADSDVNAQDKDGNVPLNWDLDNCDRVKLLLANGTNVNLANNNGETILHLAVKKSLFSIVELVLAADPDVNAQDKDGNVPLNWALDNSDIENVKLLIVNGADVNLVKNKPRQSRLHELIDRRQIELAQLLIYNGADLKIRDESDRSVLHAAVQSNLKEIVELLLLRGADINAKRKASFTPLDDAVKLENWELAELLVARGAVRANK